MKKLFVCMIAVMLVLTALASCKVEKSEDIYGSYRRKNSNGNDYFTLTLNEDGTYTYFETMISSHIGWGKYTVDGEKVTLVDTQIPGAHGSLTHVFTFKYEDGKLVYIEEESDNFMYINLPDGAEFERVDLNADSK